MRNTRKLRAMMARYGAAGTLYVGAYLLAHHLWAERRARLFAALLAVAACGGVAAGVALLRRPVAQRPAEASLMRYGAPAPAIPEPRIHLALQDDVAPLPFPSSKGSASRTGSDTIYFSGGFYHWSGMFYTDEYTHDKEETLACREDAFHLFRLKLGDRAPVQITIGDRDDDDPVLSPDGRHLAYVRGNWNRHSSLCEVSTRGGRPRSLFEAPKSHALNARTWSPDGRWIVATLATGVEGDRSDMLLVPYSGGSPITIRDVKEACSSPSGRLYLRDADGAARVFDPSSQYERAVPNPVRNADWLDEHTLVGDGPDGTDYVNSGPFRVTDDKGQVLRTPTLTLRGPDSEQATLAGEHEWSRLPGHPTMAILQTWGMSSGGGYGGCYRVNTRTGDAALIADGWLIGVAPDGSRVAIADNEWVGPYKRGGERVGPLQIIELATGRSISVTDPLSKVLNGCWAPNAARKRLGSGQALLVAVERGDVRRARSFLGRHRSARARELDGMTALMVAAADGHVEMVRLLLEDGASVNATDRNGNTALMATVGACKGGDVVPSGREIAVARLLLAAGARINAGNHVGYTALMYAARGGRATVVDWLLRKGAAPNACTSQRRTALMEAVRKAYPHTVQVLIDYRAAIQTKDGDGSAALDLAGEDSDRDEPAANLTRQLLRQAGAPDSAH